MLWIRVVVCNRHKPSSYVYNFPVLLKTSCWWHETICGNFSMPPVDTVTVNGNKILSFIYQVKGIYLVLKGPGSAEKCLFMASTRSESTISFHRLQSTWYLVISGIATKQTTERRCKLWFDLAKHQFVHFISNGSQSIVELFSLVHVLNHPIKHWIPCALQLYFITQPQRFGYENLFRKNRDPSRIN